MSQSPAPGPKAAFIDRDGVVNMDHGYVFEPEALAFVPGAVLALRTLRSLGFRLVLVTNQSGIGRGLYSIAQFERFMDHMQTSLAKEGADFDAVYHCPHLPDAPLLEFRAHCECRKPEPGMILEAIRELAVDPAQSILVGDKETDIEAGRAAGVARCFLVAKNGRGMPCALTKADGRFKSLHAMVDSIMM